MVRKGEAASSEALMVQYAFKCKRSGSKRTKSGKTQDQEDVSIKPVGARGRLKRSAKKRGRCNAESREL